tara:strand:- start:2284 stop:2466 length:183 start_codon:yes stop_codon:yes gene_type:complete
MATFACKENCGGVVAEEGMTCAPCLSKDEVSTGEGFLLDFFALIGVFIVVMVVMFVYLFW